MTEEAEAHSEANRLLEFVGLRGMGDVFARNLPYGDQRRVEMARALAMNPKILFLDEPTVGIDAQSRNLIHEQLSALNQRGTTILYTTHYMEEAQELCSRVGIIDSGRLIQQGAPAELLEQSGRRNLEDLFLQLTGKQLRDA